MFREKDVLKIFAEFTGKQLCQSLFFSKVAGLRTATSLQTNTSGSLVVLDKFLKEVEIWPKILVLIFQAVLHTKQS